MPVTLVVVTRENVEAVCRLRVAERQERFVAPAAQTVALVLDELRAMGLDEVELRYVPSADGAERFWLACGFRATGRMHGDEALARLDLR